MTDSSLPFPAIAAAVAALVVLTAWQPAAQERRPATPASAVVVFSEAGFPTLDLDPLDEPTLLQALAPLSPRFAGMTQLAEALSRPEARVLVMRYGSAFPRDGWPAIREFLERGGSLVYGGGIPFSVPVSRTTSGFVRHEPTTACYKVLGLTHPFELSAAPIAAWRIAEPAAASSPLTGLFDPTAIFPLDVRLSNTKDFPDEDGSTGPRDARVHPLIVGVDANNTPIAAPFVRIDRLQGPFAGGAWLLAPVRGKLLPQAIRALVDEALAGAVELTARPTFAGFHPGETPSVDVMLRRPGRTANTAPVQCLVEVREAAGRLVSSTRTALTGTAGVQLAHLDIPLKTPLPRGLYKVRATLDVPSDVAAAPALRVRSTTGFWVYDAAMLSGGTPLTVKGSVFLRGGQPFPVTGTTYMASDVHRKFLLEPNPYLWDRDFAMMKVAGVNLVRTGLWSGWKLYMPEVGTIPEAVLRSLDVFLLTARAHDIPVIFTLFAFLPEAWTGQNPYLDPRSVQAQRLFATRLAHRYAGVRDLAWDLINEPSFSSPAHLWNTRPNYDAFEADAWQAWLLQRHPGATATNPAPILDAWGAATGESTGLPALDDFADRNLFGDKRPQKAFDYRLFAQDAFREWTRTMSEALHGAAPGSNSLITVGQDEGGLGERPGPLFFGRNVDFTCMHTWWNNDAQAWDSVLSRRPQQPLLVEETGLMRYERLDGTPWRTEFEAAALLERKLAIAFGTGAAGVVQWIWNTNPFMPSDNEAGIGFFRADGTARPELRPFAEVARFLRLHASKLATRAAEDVVLFVPHANMLSVRDGGTEATRRAVRALYYQLQVPVRAVGEYEAADTVGNPRLIIAPSPTVLSDTAWKTLLEAVERGAWLVISGNFDRDDYWRAAPRSASLGLTVSRRPIQGEERLAIDGTEFTVGFRGEKLERVERSVVSGRAGNEVIRITRGKGTILWSPLPLELGESIEPTVAFYRSALAQAGLKPVVTVDRAVPGVFVGANQYGGILLVALASESGDDRDVLLTHTASGAKHAIPLPAGRALLVLLDASTGKLIDRSHPPVW